MGHNRNRNPLSHQNPSESRGSVGASGTKGNIGSEGTSRAGTAGTGTGTGKGPNGAAGPECVGPKGSADEMGGAAGIEGVEAEGIVPRSKETVSPENTESDSCAVEVDGGVGFEDTGHIEAGTA